MKISTSTNPFTVAYGEEEGIRMFAEAGFDGLDFGLFHLSPDCDVFTKLSDTEFEEYFKRIGAAADANSIEIFQVHAPFPLKAFKPERDPILMECAKKSIYATKYMNSKYVVIHPIIPAGCIYGRNNEYARKVNFEFYGELIPILKETGVKMAVENMFAGDPDTRKHCPTVCSSAEEMIDYIDSLNEIAGEECFVACLDTGHSAISGSGPADMIRKLGSRVKILHVQDNDGLSDSHTAPGLGKLNWKDIANALEEIGYDGMFNFEADNFYYIWKAEAYQRKLDLEAAKMLCKIGHAIVG